MPQFSEAGVAQNADLLALIENTAREKHATPAQISLAWMLGKRPYIVPIPGSRKESRIRENLNAANIELTREEVKKIDGRAGANDDVRSIRRSSLELRKERLL